jgi:hypothetical protein
MIQCPGCGGRNTESAAICDWCARPLQGNGRERPRRGSVVPVLVGVVLIALAVAAVIVISTMSRPPSGAGAPVIVVSSPLPSNSPRPMEPTVIPTVTPAPAAAPVVRRARVVNTGGEGALVRREPSVNAPSAGLVREEGIVTLLGPEETVQAQVWRQVEDSQGNQGWIRADYLAQIEEPTPLPLAPPP